MAAWAVVLAGLLPALGAVVAGHRRAAARCRNASRRVPRTCCRSGRRPDSWTAAGRRRRPTPRLAVTVAILVGVLLAPAHRVASAAAGADRRRRDLAAVPPGVLHVPLLAAGARARPGHASTRWPGSSSGPASCCRSASSSRCSRPSCSPAPRCGRLLEPARQHGPRRAQWRDDVAAALDDPRLAHRATGTRRPVAIASPTGTSSRAAGRLGSRVGRRSTARARRSRRW